MLEIRDIFCNAAKFALKEKKQKQNLIAKALNMSISSVNNYVNGHREGDEGTRTKIAEHLGYDYISFMSLGRHIKETGSAEGWVKPSAITVNEGFALRTKADAATTDEETVYIKLYDVAGSCGNGSYADSEAVLDVMSFRKTWIRNELRLDPDHLSLIFVTGGSMEPTLMPGDIVMINHAATNSIDDGVWAMAIGDGNIIVKRIERRSTTEVRIISDNGKIEPRDIDLKDLPDGMRFIGRVVWSGRRM